jgi:hypothetical protein
MGLLSPPIRPTLWYSNTVQLYVEFSMTTREALSILLAFEWPRP